MLDLTRPLTDIVTHLESRAVGAVELLEAHLARVERLDPAITAVVTLDADRAFATARKVDAERVAGEPLGPLAGVPITIKDAIATEGIRSTGGAVELRDHVPETDAAAVATVRRAGAIVFGKTNVPRWSGDYQTFNELFGTTNNPWDLDRTPGGSSGGPAAAVAMGFTGFEIGTDIGGSIRVPSSFCGIYGHKPSFGVIPTYGYLDSVRFHRNVSDVNVLGPLARSIEDLDLLFGLLAGPNPDDAVGWRLDLPPSRATELSDFRVAAWLDSDFAPVDPSVGAVLGSAVAALESAGARIDHDARPALDPAAAAYDGSLLISLATAISDSDELAGPDRAHEPVSHRQWDVRHRERGRVRRRWAEFFDDVDVLLCPVTPIPPFRHVHSEQGSNWATATIDEFGGMPYGQLVLWNALIGSAYLPVTTPPVGFTADGLPVGIQVVAPYLHDHTALTFARRITEVVGGYQPPPLATDADG